MDDSNSRADQDAPPIFLSHSGKQKPFVESLNNALRDANHTPFFDKHTIPKGTTFPSEIEKAAGGCKLGVVVLSDDFLTSRWPMLELEMLVLKRGPNASVLPLFYKLSPDDLKSPENLLKWQKIWKEKDPERAEEWERAVKAIGRIVGVLFNSEEGESAYIKRVVRAICKHLPSPILYDLSHVKGKDRLEKEVRRHFEKVARQCDTVRMVGLYAVGGSGKTTICKIMGNHYNSQYLGKFCHIEFPSDNDEKKIVQECKKALKTLANLSDEHVLKRADDFDQVVQLIKEKLGRYDVFLAIDNVWESTREKAERLLGVGFSANSKILLTSRSAQVLKDLLSRHMNTHLGPLPAPDSKEALQIFQETFKSHGDLESSVINRNRVDSVLQKCFLSGSYHALALKALSQHVKRACELQGSHSLSRILAEISNRDLQTVGDLIKLNYGNLPEHKQHLFLDIVVVVMKAASSSCEEANQWLSILYKQYSESRISNLIYELASDGLIQLEEGGECGKMIRVHDLYSDLAKTEAASSSRFFIVDGPFITRSPVEEIEWERLERVILTSGCNADFVAKLQQAKCHKLQVLYAVLIDFKSRIDIMNLMPSLCVLKLQGGRLRSIKNWSAATRLEICHLYRLQSLTCLEGLELTHNASSRALKEVHIVWCGALRKVPDLSGLTCLERLELTDNGSMEEVGGLSRALKEVRILWCGALQKVPDLSGLTCLERLELIENRSMEEVGDLSRALKEVCIAGCEALRKVPDLSGLTCLERLELSGNGSMEEVGGLSRALKQVRIVWCGALQKVPDLRGLTCLERLELIENGSMEEVGDLNGALKEVRILRCGALRKVPDLSGLTCLERLELIENRSMEEVGDLSRALKEVRILRCVALQKVPDLRGLTCLERLELSRNGSMEEMRCDLGGENSELLKYLTRDES